MKRLLKNNRGMSLMEILVALSLLMIIIVGTTPVMLQAYNGLYTAGEYTQNVYNAKTEVEDQLATRSSVRPYTGFKVNFEGLGEVATVNAKRAVSSLKNSLESLFANARVRIYISSGSIVDDNQSNHSITLQTVNLEFASIDDISVDGTALSKDGKKIGITAYLPQKNATSSTAASVYTDARKATVTIVDDTTVPAAGRIGINISSDKYPIDFTTSPIKIVVSYLDENNKPKSAHTYLTIKTPSIMIAGETNNNVQYYTTAGVQEIKDSNGNVTQRKFNVEARTMNIGYNLKSDISDIGENAAVGKSANLGAASTQAVPANTVFKSVNWITEFARTTGGTNNENIEYANTVYEPEYYVLTGTNGVIYRTYTFEKLNDITGKVNFDTGISNFGINGLYLNTLTNQSQKGKDVMGIKDKYIVLDDRASTVVYPAVWGGDFSHIFGYSAYGEQAGYTVRTDPGNTNASWYTQHSYTEVVSGVDSTRVRGIGSEGYYSNLACYGYYYNGYALDTEYHSMNSRKISYILTEIPTSMRVGGYMGGVGGASEYGYDGQHFDRIWERPVTPDYSASQRELDGTNGTPNLKLKKKNWSEAWFYARTGSNIPLASIVKEELDDDDYQSERPHFIPTYFVEEDNTYDRPDNGFAQLRLKVLTTLSPTVVYTRGGHEDIKTDMRVAYDNDDNYSKITVTDAVYIPSATGGAGSVFYVGTVAAYAMVNQVDNVGLKDDSPDVIVNRNTPTKNTGRLTSYWVVSSDDGKTTTIYKHSTKSEYITKSDRSVDIPHDTIRERLMNATTRNSSLYSSSNAYGKKSYDLTNAVKANSTESHQFFISQPLTKNGDSYSEKVSGRIFSDVCFTMGYTSNREMVYTNIVYGKDENDKLIQSLKFCEPYYFLSHYGNKDHNPNLYMNWEVDPDETLGDYMNKADNDYYNVWFPGEMYNLTKVATKDNVTVAVGYAVAGSSYSYLNTLMNASTGLGAIYNDGVISGMVLGEDDAFKSLLYFKDNASMDATSLTDGTVKFEQHGTSGQNGSWVSYSDIGFPWTYGTHARDSVQFTCVDISVVVSGDTTYYYAYYADNKGRVYRSLVATREKGAAAATMVNYISDKSSSTGLPTNVSYMEEQTFVVGEWTMKGSNYFEKINTIAAHDDLIVITGKTKPETTYKLNILVGVIDKENPTAAPTWKLLTWGYHNFVVHDALIRDGYLYLVGENETNPCGFILAVPLDTLRSADSNTSISGTFKDNVDDHKLKFYAIAGKE